MKTSAATHELPAAAVDAFHVFVGRCRYGRTIIAHDVDADGVSAGIILEAALRRSGITSVQRFLPDRTRNPWSETNRASLAALEPSHLFLLDLGARAEPVLDNVPACSIDHHAVDRETAAGTVISSYGWTPSPNTSLLVWRLCGTLTDVSDLDWVAAIGTLGDHGAIAAYPALRSVTKKYSLARLKDIVVLINAARRASPSQAEAGARLLASSREPRDFLAPTPELRLLREARWQIQAALADGKRAAPKFADSVALIQVESPCQIHPVLAQIWRTRLPRHIVIVANRGYVPGRVHFSVRGPVGTNVLAFLRALPLEPGEGEYGHGHDAASGGSLPIARWTELLRILGFAADPTPAPPPAPPMAEC
jgi:single-stranded DNA-specific DHH superfamily exonuclease